MDMHARVLGEERRDLPPPMDRAAVPEHVDGIAQVTEQMVQEGPDAEARNVARATAAIERQPSPLG